MSHTTQFIHLKALIYSQSYSNITTITLEHFHYPQRNLIPNSDHSPPTPWILANINLPFCLRSLSTVDISHKCPFLLRYSQHNVHVQLHFFLGVKWCFIVWIYHICYPFIGRWMFEWFPLFGSNLWCYEHSCTNFCVNMFSFLLGIKLWKIARSFGNDTLFNIPRNYQTIIKATIPRYIPISSVYEFQFLYILIDICYENLTFWLQPSNCLWSSILLVLLCISLIAKDTEYLFHVVIDHGFFPLEKCLFIFAHL